MEPAIAGRACCDAKVHVDVSFIDGRERLQYLSVETADGDAAFHYIS